MCHLFFFRSTTVRRANLLVGAALALAIPLVAGAQDTTAAVAATASDPARHTESTIIYSRDVNHTVGAPYFPGQSHSLVTAPTNLIIDSLGNGLTPLSDDEIGSVAAALTSPMQIVETTMGSNLDGLSSSQGGSGLAAHNQQGSHVGSAVSSGMASLSSALGAVSAALGSDR